MYKLFSIEQANSLIPQVDQTLTELRSTQADLKEIAGQLKAVEPFTVEARNLYFESAFLAQQLQALKTELDRLGVKVANPQPGGLGIPGQLGAELAHLTREAAQQSVS